MVTAEVPVIVTGLPVPPPEIIVDEGVEDVISGS
jgi:hypothetical protein